MFDLSRLSRKWTPARILSEPYRDEGSWALSFGVEKKADSISSSGGCSTSDELVRNSIRGRHFRCIEPLELGLRSGYR